MAEELIENADCGVSFLTEFWQEKYLQEYIKNGGSKIKFVTGRQGSGKTHFLGLMTAAAKKENYKTARFSAKEIWLHDFKDIYFEGNEEYAKAFMGDNPLINCAYQTIYLSEAAMQESLVNYLESIPDVRKINKSELTANSFADFGMLIGYVSGAIILILLAVAVFLISNTVSVGITVRREEISIMKLIGATDFFVRAPFLVEGILIGLVGAAIPLAAIYYLYGNVITYVLDQFSILSNVMVFLPIEDVFRSLLPVGLILGVGIGFLGSSTTTRKHLRV